MLYFKFALSKLNATNSERIWVDCQPILSRHKHISELSSTYTAPPFRSRHHHPSGLNRANLLWRLGTVLGVKFADYYIRHNRSLCQFDSYACRLLSRSINSSYTTAEANVAAVQSDTAR